MSWGSDASPMHFGWLSHLHIYVVSAKKSSLMAPCDKSNFIRCRGARTPVIFRKHPALSTGRKGSPGSLGNLSSSWQSMSDKCPALKSLHTSTTWILVRAQHGALTKDGGWPLTLEAVLSLSVPFIKNSFMKV